MTKKTQPTDDVSFRDYLNSICLNSLFEHARATMLYEIIIEIMLRYDYLYDDCITFLDKDISFDKNKSLKENLEDALNELDEEYIKDIMTHLFSKKLVVDMLLECTDEYAREDIIYNQNYWHENKVCGIDHSNVK
jgi:hypothetical protein